MAKKKDIEESKFEETSGEMMLEETTDDPILLEESSSETILEEASDSPTMLEESSATSETLLEETSTSPKTKAVKEDKQKAREAERKAEEATKRKVERDALKDAKEAEKKREAAAAKKKADEAARRKAAEEEEKRAERRREEEKAKAKAEKTKYIWIVIGSHIAGFLLIAVSNYICGLFDSDNGFSWEVTLIIFLSFAVIVNYTQSNEARKEGHVFQSILNFSLGTLWLLIGGIWLWMGIKSALPPNEEELKTELMTRYDSIYNVGKDNLRIVEKDGKKGLVDKRGNVKFAPQYDEILEPLEKEELITVKREEKEEIQKRLLTSRIVVSSGKKGLLLTGEKIGDDVSNLSCHTRFEPQYDSIYYDVESKHWRAMQY